MGIVVTLFMLLALLILSPIAVISLGKYRENPKIVNQLGLGILLVGLWNSLWFGLQNLQIFWGVAAFVSGLAMILASILIVKEQGNSRLACSVAMTKIYQVIRPVKFFVILVLLANFALYSITLIQLNLGYNIIH